MNGSDIMIWALFISIIILLLGYMYISDNSKTSKIIERTKSDVKIQPMTELLADKISILNQELTRLRQENGRLAVENNRREYR
jgi:hypothetical protein